MSDGSGGRWMSLLNPRKWFRRDFLNSRNHKEPKWEELPKLLPLRTTARILGIHPNTLRLWDQRGTVRAVRLGSRQDRRFDRDQVRAVWIAQRATTSPAVHLELDRLPGVPWVRRFRWVLPGALIVAAGLLIIASSR